MFQPGEFRLHVPLPLGSASAIYFLSTGFTARGQWHSYTEKGSGRNHQL